jgi:biotin carboxylase
MRNVFILGAGFMQKPAILTAKELGCRVIAADGNKDACCVSLCDEFAHIDLKNIDALCEFALNLKKNSEIDAVFTAGTDFSAACAKIAELCGLHSHSYEAALNASDKIRMRKCFAKSGVRSPEFIEIEDNTFACNAENILQLLRNNGFSHNPFPLVVKPVDNMGARGCRMVRSGNELEEAVKTAVSYSRSKRAILEEYMDGPEFSIDSLVYNGTITITGFADRHIYYPPYFIEMGHTLPSAVSEEQKSILFEEFKKGVKSLGLSCGAAKGDVKLTKDGPKIGEIAARLSGGYMSGWTYPYASGINLTEQALRIALGDAPSISLTGMPKEPRAVSAERAYISIPGIIKSVSGCEEAKNIPYVKNIFPRVKAGDIVSFPVNNVEKCGNIISCAENREEAVKSAESAVKNIIIRLDAGCRTTKEFLEEDLLTEFPPSAYKASKNDIDPLLTASKGKTISIENIIQNARALLPYFLRDNDLCDWNHKSALFALEQFCIIAEKEDKKSRIVNVEQFWRYFLRGGLQGLLYLLDGEA